LDWPFEQASKWERFSYAWGQVMAIYYIEYLMDGANSVEAVSFALDVSIRCEVEGVAKDGCIQIEFANTELSLIKEDAAFPMVGMRDISVSPCSISLK
jgi:hypothetical protein